MQISFEEAEKITQTLLNSSTFTTKQILKLLATSAEELEFPFPYEEICMSPTSSRERFLLYFRNDSSKKGEVNMNKLVKRLLSDCELDPHFV